MFEKFKKLLTKSNDKDNETPHDSMRNNISSPSGFYPPIPLAYTFYKRNSYDNAYSSIHKIVNAFMTIQPYAVDADGKRMKETPNVLNRFYKPNLNMSAIDFREALAVMTLVHPKVYLLLWRKEGDEVIPGGTITEENLAGFTFMEGVAELRVGGKKYYQWNGRTYGIHEVIEIFSGYDPYNLSRGYAPSDAIQKWASVDDYIAAYQAGLFENGAVPSGQFLITAKNSDEYKKIVDGMQRAHRGSGKNNNVIYAHRPIDPNSGAAAPAQIEWVPFAQTNKEMSLDSVFKQANDKIDSAFGVPASIRGVNDNNTYASVRVDEQNFVKYTVKPFATKIYSRLNHELNRITGGMGYAISFELDIPGVAEEEKMNAERKMTEFNLINTAANAGYTLDSIVEAFGLPEAYKTLKMGPQAPVVAENEPEVDEGAEVENAPGGNTDEKAKITKPSHNCSHHSHKIAARDEGVVEEIAKTVREVMSKQIEAVIERGNLEKDIDGTTLEEMENESQEEEEKRNEELAAAILTVILIYMMQQGEISYAEGTTLLATNGINVENLQGFQINEATKSQYQAYLNNVAKAYNADTAQKIRSVLAEGQTMGWNKEQMAAALRGIMDTDEWRVQRLARTEEHRTVNQSSVDAMKQLMTETGAKIYKIWHNNSSEPCEFCAAFDEKRELVSGSFLPKGGQVAGINGGTFLNTFVDVDAADLHPNCNCYLTYEVER